MVYKVSDSHKIRRIFFHCVVIFCKRQSIDHFLREIQELYSLAMSVNIFAGGYGVHERWNSTEIFENGAFKTGPELPQAIQDHCMISLNTTHSMLTGGFNGVRFFWTWKLSCFSAMVKSHKIWSSIFIWALRSCHIQILGAFLSDHGCLKHFLLFILKRIDAFKNKNLGKKIRRYHAKL